MARYVGLFVAAALCGVFSVFGGEVIVIPDDAALEKWAVAATYHASELEPEIRVSGNSAIQFPLSGGGTGAVFSQTNADVKLEQNFESAGLSFVFRPKTLRYMISVGQVRRFELEFASNTVTNSLRGNDGVRLGVGIGGSFAPLTAASLGIGWSLDYRYIRADLDRFESAGVVSPSSQRIEQDEFQGAVTAAYRWKSLAPLAGVKLQKWITRLRDETTKESVRGEVEGMSPFVGVEWTPFPGEGVIVEMSLVDEKSVTASWIAKF